MRRLMSEALVSEISVGSVVEFQLRCPVVVTEIVDAYVGEPDPHPHIAEYYGPARAFIGYYLNWPEVRTLHVRRERSRVAGPGSVQV